MSLNLLDAVRGYFDNSMLNQAAGYLGESDATVKQSLDAVIPASLSAIAKKAESAPDTVFNLAKEAYNSGIANNLGEHFRVGGPGIPSSGPSILNSVFGDKFGAVANAVSGSTGAKGASISSLFGIVMPLALALIGKYSAENHSSPAAIASLLGSQKNAFHSSIPSGLNISRPLGLVDDSHVAAAVAETKKSTNWLVPLLLILAGILLLWWLYKTCNKPKEETTITRDTLVNTTPPAVVAETTTTTTTTTQVVSREPVKLKLPDGIELDAYKGGIEDKFLAFINDANAKPGKDVWFDFRDLNFEFGTAKIVPASRGEVDNISKILHAYPKVKVKIGGYTDKVGAEEDNMALSDNRAKAVANALKGAGVGSQVLGAEGYGSKFAKYEANAPDSLRLKDRHVSLSPREK